MDTTVRRVAPGAVAIIAMACTASVAQTEAVLLSAFERICVPGFPDVDASASRARELGFVRDMRSDLDSTVIEGWRGTIVGTDVSVTFSAGRDHSCTVAGGGDFANTVQAVSVRPFVGPESRESRLLTDFKSREQGWKFVAWGARGKAPGDIVYVEVPPNTPGPFVAISLYRLPPGARAP
jgi:hypothetical protein